MIPRPIRPNAPPQVFAINAALNTSPTRILGGAITQFLPTHSPLLRLATSSPRVLVGSSLLLSTATTLTRSFPASRRRRSSPTTTKCVLNGRHCGADVQSDHSHEESEEESQDVSYCNRFSAQSLADGSATPTPWRTASSVVRSTQAMPMRDPTSGLPRSLTSCSTYTKARSARTTLQSAAISVVSRSL